MQTAHKEKTLNTPKFPNDSAFLKTNRYYTTLFSNPKKGKLVIVG